MSDCSALKAFRDNGGGRDQGTDRIEDSILEVCVYPVISEESIRRLARVIREWVPE